MAVMRPRRRGRSAQAAASPALREAREPRSVRSWQGQALALESALETTMRCPELSSECSKADRHTHPTQIRSVPEGVNPWPLSLPRFRRLGSVACRTTLLPRCFGTRGCRGTPSRASSIRKPRSRRSIGNSVWATRCAGESQAWAVTSSALSTTRRPTSKCKPRSLTGSWCELGEPPTSRPAESSRRSGWTQSGATLRAFRLAHGSALSELPNACAEWGRGSDPKPLSARVDVWSLKSLHSASGCAPPTATSLWSCARECSGSVLVFWATAQRRLPPEGVWFGSVAAQERPQLAPMPSGPAPTEPASRDRAGQLARTREREPDGRNRPAAPRGDPVRVLPGIAGESSSRC